MNKHAILLAGALATAFAFPAAAADDAAKASMRQADDTYGAAKAGQGRREIGARPVRHQERRREEPVQEGREGDARQDDGRRRSRARQGQGRLQGQEVAATNDTLR